VTRYTVGQRRGLNVAVGDPLFVVRIDADARQVIVGPKEALRTAAVVLKEINWLDARPPEGRPVLARVRSTAEPTAATMTGDTVTFAEPEYGVSPGQACVLYAPEAPDRVLGGGFIESTIRAA
jgi:tRNA-uridine 2-sulfurtransferase